MAGQKFVGRLTPEVLARAARSGGWPKRAALFRHLRKESGVTGTEREFGALKAGGYVKLGLARGTAAYFAGTWGVAFTEDMVERAAEPVDSVREPGVDAWQSATSGVARWLSDRLASPGEAKCGDDAAVRHAAELIVRSVGRKHRAGSEDDALALGERIMDVTAARYGDFLRRMWNRDDRVVMQTLAVPAGGLERVPCGASVVLPLAEDAYRRLRRGDIRDTDLTPDDLAVPTQWLFIDAMGDLPPGGRVTPKLRGVAQVHTMFCQFAAFTQGIPGHLVRPAFLTLSGSPGTAKRAAAFGLEETGTVMPGVGKALMELTPPGDDAAGDMGFHLTYESLAMTIRVYQRFLRTTREKR